MNSSILTTADFYLIRTPSFSINRLSELNGHLEKNDILAIKKILSDDFFLKAIYFSSREFYKIAKSWVSDDTIVYDREDKILITLYKYYNRICSRSTPYGLFAGFAEGRCSKEASKITFCRDRSFDSVFRADMIFLSHLKKEILRQEGDQRILYYPNNTIYQFGEKLRFIEWDHENNYEISETSVNQLIQQILTKAKDGITRAEIYLLVCAAYDDLEESEITGYIDELINSKVLVDQLPPYLTGTENPVMELYEQLAQKHIEASSLIELNSFVSAGYDTISVDAIEEFSKPYEDYFKPEHHYFQVDLKLRLSENNLNENVVKEILSNALELMTGIEKRQTGRMITFRDKLYHKFENKEIPLAHALDPQLGVGYDLHVSGNVEEMPLLENLDFSYGSVTEGLENLPLINIILRKYLKNLDHLNQQPIVFTEEDIKGLPGTDHQYKWHLDYHLLGDLLAADTESLDKGEYKFFCKSAVPSPYMSNLFSRFAYHDQALADKLKAHNAVDEEADYIYAEIIHHPGGRIGNILLRPKIFDYDIPYVTNTNPAHHQIDLDDILVSVRNNEVFLRSKSLNKEIRPRLSSAHNFSKEQLPVFRFLCALQYQNINFGVEWDWSILSSQVYLPRVQYKKLILSEARWKIVKNKNASLDKLREEISKLHIPKACKIKEGDNIILIDTENLFALNILLRNLKKHDLLIYEHLDGTDFIANDGNKYCSEFLFPVVNNRKAGINRKLLYKEKLKKRIFYPGEEWMYLKIYCSHMVGDSIVSSVIKNTIDFFNDRDHTDLVWFFIRYDDPDHHIRFRVRSTDVNGFLNVINKYLVPSFKEELVFSVQLDTYKREIERYSDEYIEQSELLFWYDSRAIMQFLGRLNDYEDQENIRWKTAIASIDLLLDNFNLPVTRRKLLFEKAYQNFLPEFVDISDKDAVKQFKYSVDQKLRAERDFLDTVIRRKDYSDNEVFMDSFHQRSRDNDAVIIFIQKDLRDEERLTDLLLSYIHMSLNRFFYAKARMHELVIYYFMFKTYNSILNRDEK